MATAIKAETGDRVSLYAHYGYTLELTRNDAGHLGALMSTTAFDGVIGQIASADRGLGSVGGPVTVTDSITRTGMELIIVDDTRTGVERDKDGGFVRRPDLPTDDVIHVLQRNFAAALMDGAGVAWADPNGNGNLHDAELWSQLAGLRELYATHRKKQEIPGSEEGGLYVVTDNESRFYQRRDQDLNQWLIAGTRNAALKLGAPVRFVSFDDLLDGDLDRPDAYLFVNVFKVTQQDRARLHERFAREAAAAIWLYASGYFDGSSYSVEHLSATTGVGVAAFDESHRQWVDVRLVRQLDRERAYIRCGSRTGSDVLHSRRKRRRAREVSRRR